MTMKITLDIQENKFSAFLAFIKTLDYVSVPDDSSIPQWQIDEVNQRLKDIENNTNQPADFDNMVNDIEAKYGL